MGAHYHDKDCINACLANCSCYGLHHWAIAKMDMEICCSGHFQVIK